MKNKELADSYRTWFKYIWDTCPKKPDSFKEKITEARKRKSKN